MPNKTLFLKLIFKPGMQRKLRKGLAQEKHGPQPIHKETLTGPLTTKRLSTMLYFAPNHESTQHISYNCEKKVKVGSLLKISNLISKVSTMVQSLFCIKHHLKHN